MHACMSFSSSSSVGLSQNPCLRSTRGGFPLAGDDLIYLDSKSWYKWVKDEEYLGGFGAVAYGLVLLQIRMCSHATVHLLGDWQVLATYPYCILMVIVVWSLFHHCSPGMTLNIFIRTRNQKKNWKRWVTNCPWIIVFRDFIILLNAWNWPFPFLSFYYKG